LNLARTGKMATKPIGKSLDVEEPSKAVGDSRTHASYEHDPEMGADVVDVARIEAVYK
jgi:hypothetical protein